MRRTVRFLAALAAFLVLTTVGVHAAADQRGVLVRPRAPTGEEVTGKLWLLAIGVNRYLSWPPLRTAVNDAQAVTDVLLKRYHIDKSHVIQLLDEDATRHNIIGAFRGLARKVGAEDSLLVYYAGHGYIDPITGEGSWIPVESGRDDPSSWVSNHEVKNYLKMATPATVMTIPASGSRPRCHETVSSSISPACRHVALLPVLNM